MKSDPRKSRVADPKKHPPPTAVGLLLFTDISNNKVIIEYVETQKISHAHYKDRRLRPDWRKRRIWEDGMRNTRCANISMHTCRSMPTSYQLERAKEKVRNNGKCG